MIWPPTLADDLDMVEELVTDPRQTIRATTEIRAPCCDRKVAADMVADLRGVEAIDADWLCDGCRDAVCRDQASDWTWSRLMQKLGAPWEEVRHERAKEVARDLKRLRRERDEGYRWGDLIEQAQSVLPTEAVDLMAERPAESALAGH